jgi:RNA-binding protein YhbY
MVEVDKRLRKRAVDPTLEVTIRVGKSGLTDSVVSELNSQLKTRAMVKVKLNRGLADDSADRQNLWQMLAEQTSSKLILMRGNIAVFYR